MRSMLSLLLCLPFSFLIAQSSSQYIIPAQGGYAKGESMSLSWTIGDLVTETGLLEKSMMTQGFQQPIISVQEVGPDGQEIFATENPNYPGSALSKRDSDEFTASVFPNPFGTNITVNVDNSKQEYYLDIFDPAGNLISRTRSSSPQEVIHFYDLPASQYVLRISLIESRQSKIFKIIKTR